MMVLTNAVSLLSDCSVRSCRLNPAYSSAAATALLGSAALLGAAALGSAALGALYFSSVLKCSIWVVSKGGFIHAFFADIIYFNRSVFGFCSSVSTIYDAILFCSILHKSTSEWICDAKIRSESFFHATDSTD